MGWNPFSKKGWEQAGKKLDPRGWGNDAKNELEKPLNEIKDFLNDSKKEIERAANEVERESKSVLQQIEKEGQSAIKKIDGAGQGVIQKIESTGRATLEDVEKEFGNLKEGSQALVQNALDEMAKGVSKRAMIIIRDTVHGAQHVLQEFEAGVSLTEKTLKTMKELGFPDPADPSGEVIDALNELGTTIQIAAVDCRYQNFYTRVKSLVVISNNLVDEPPKLRRSHIINGTLALVADKYELGASLQAAALVVSMKEAGGGVVFENMRPVLFAGVADHLMAKIGIPA